MSIELIAVFILALWLLIVSIYVYNTHRIISALSKEAKQEDFIKVLNKVLKTEVKHGKDIAHLQKSLEDANLKATKHLQKVGYVRFNPFNELGGDHSFVLALLNDHDTGVLITGLHTRERTRVYMKEVIKGKTKSESSKEERQALRLAQRQ